MREDGTGGWTDPWSWQTGVANPAARAARLTSFDSKDSPVVKLANAIAERYPWLDDDGDELGDGPHPGLEMIEVGRQHFVRGPGGWIKGPERPYHGPARALWILEALLGTVSAQRWGDCEVHGQACGRYLAEVRPGELAGRPDIQLIDAPGEHDDWTTLSAEFASRRPG